MVHERDGGILLRCNDPVHKAGRNGNALRAGGNFKVFCHGWTSIQRPMLKSSHGDGQLWLFDLLNPLVEPSCEDFFHALPVGPGGCLM